ncbi:UNVERIFIED_CONTAM: Organic cation/carnitine transporter 7 [Sesamum radiatum]|uniref:Organic cation/carnitine transporter 7 n=1 Tax=Sesamum radiatum TaxID=300843 RepID=A0AAW2KMS2_SESRA
MGDEVSHGYTVDEALSSLGFGTFQGAALVFAGIGWFADAMEVTLLSFIGPALESEWSVSPTEESFLSTAIFGGMIVGSYFFGFIADAYGRRMGIRGVAIVTFAAGLLSAFSPDYKSLVVLRFLVGFGAAGGHVYSSWFLEFIPTFNRGVWMLIMSFSWVIGELLETSLAWLIMPRWGWRWLLALTSVPSLAMLLLSSFAPETPRYLFMKGRTNEAVSVLERVALMNRKELPTGSLVSDHRRTKPDEENVPSEETPLLSSESKKRDVKRYLGSLPELFSSDLLGITILIWIMFFSCIFAYYGIQLMISTLSSGQSDCRSLSIPPENAQNDSLYINVLIACLAGGHVYAAWFLEFIPSSNRGAWMLVMMCSWILGELLEASLAWIIMPRWGWRWLLALSSVPSFTVLLLSTFVPESPRYLFTKGRSDEAIRVLEKIALVNRKELHSGSLVSDHQKKQPDEVNFPSEETHLISSSESKTRSFEKCLGSVSELLSPDLLGTTLLAWIMFFAYTFAYYGIQLMVSALSSRHSDCDSSSILPNNVQNDNLYINVFITCLAEIPGLLLAMVLVERFGRKLCMEILTILTVIVILPLLSHQNGTVTTALLVSGRMFLSAAFNTLCVYTEEVYPTSVRASGYGLATAVGRIGGMICPLVAVGLVRGCHQTLAVIFFGIVILISGIAVLFFPFETKGRGLTDVVSNKECI